MPMNKSDNCWKSGQRANGVQNTKNRPLVILKFPKAQVAPSAKGAAGAFSCAECGRAFGTKSLLTRHAAVVHSAERPFPCEDCGRAFKSRTNLKVSEFVINIPGFRVK